MAAAAVVGGPMAGTTRGSGPLDTTSGTFEPLGSWAGTPGARARTTSLRWLSSYW